MHNTNNTNNKNECLIDKINCDSLKDEEITLHIKRNPTFDIIKLTKSPNFTKKMVELYK